MDTAQRIAGLERALGVPLPRDYRAYLARQVESQGVQWVVSSNPDYWGVSAILEMGNGPDYLQADAVHRVVGDVIPHGMLAVAEDSPGNLYLLDCRPGPTRGAIYWWDHEQGAGEDRVEKAADSFAQFVASLVPDAD